MTSRHWIILTKFCKNDLCCNRVYLYCSRGLLGFILQRVKDGTSADQQQREIRSLVFWNCQHFVSPTKWGHQRPFSNTDHAERQAQAWCSCWSYFCQYQEILFYHHGNAGVVLVLWSPALVLLALPALESLMQKTESLQENQKIYTCMEDPGHAYRFWIFFAVLWFWFPEHIRLHRTRGRLNWRVTLLPGGNFQKWVAQVN